jgi:hypothetical protein
MARLNHKLPWSRITIHDKEYIIQFKVIEEQGKTEALLFEDMICIARGTAILHEDDVFNELMGKKIALENALFKLDKKLSVELNIFVKSIFNKQLYRNKQIWYKCFKKDYEEVEEKRRLL